MCRRTRCWPSDRDRVAIEELLRRWRAARRRSSSCRGCQAFVGEPLPPWPQLSLMVVPRERAGLNRGVPASRAEYMARRSDQRGQGPRPGPVPRAPRGLLHPRAVVEGEEAENESGGASIAPHARPRMRIAALPSHRIDPAGRAAVRPPHTRAVASPPLPLPPLHRPAQPQRRTRPARPLVGLTSSSAAPSAATVEVAAAGAADELVGPKRRRATTLTRLLPTCAGVNATQRNGRVARHRVARRRRRFRCRRRRRHANRRSPRHCPRRFPSRRHRRPRRRGLSRPPLEHAPFRHRRHSRNRPIPTVARRHSRHRHCCRHHRSHLRRHRRRCRA